MKLEEAIFNNDFINHHNPLTEPSNLLKLYFTGDPQNCVFINFSRDADQEYLGKEFIKFGELILENLKKFKGD